jgi:hypothetical protein
MNDKSEVEKKFHFGKLARKTCARRRQKRLQKQNAPGR